MRKDLTDVTLVVDRSGSMQTCQQEAQSGINHFIEEQKKAAGDCLLSLVHFDTEYEFVHRGKNIKEVASYTLTPRGMTALLDAVGRAINEAGVRLAAMTEEQRPGLVVFVIVTDGQENSSHEFNKPQVKKLIEEQRDKYNWQFTFLGANQDAFAEAASLGIPTAAAANFTQHNAGVAYRSSSDNVKRMRSATASGSKVSCCYTDAEKRSMSQ